MQATAASFSRTSRVLLASFSRYFGLIAAFSLFWSVVHEFAAAVAAIEDLTERLGPVRALPIV